MRSLVKSRVFGIIVLLFLPQVGVRADDRPKAHVRVINADGEPVPDAVIQPAGLRTRAERASHYFWSEEHHGELPQVTTDSDGRAELPYPKFVVEQLETGEVTWSVDHDDYISFRGDFSVDLNPAEIIMQRGRRIALTAVSAESGERLKEGVHAILSGSGSVNEWKTLSNGMIMSRAVAFERDFLRVLHLSQDGDVLFSDPVFLHSEDRGLRKLLKDVPLRSGTRIAGRIDEQVPRPVRNGHVAIVATSLIQDDNRNSTLRWSDWADIRPDGTFVATPVPRDSIVMLIAVCDGWISSAPTAQELNRADINAEQVGMARSMVLPQFLRTEGDLVERLIRMEQTATCRVTVTDPDGNPVKDATVSFWPNQFWPGYGSQIVGDSLRTAAWLKMQADERENFRGWWNSRERMQELGVIRQARPAYSVTTDGEGIAVVLNLPAGSADQTFMAPFVVDHEMFEMPKSPDHALSREARVHLIRGNMSEVTVKMNPRGTELISQ